MRSCICSKTNGQWYHYWFVNLHFFNCFSGIFSCYWSWVYQFSYWLYIAVMKHHYQKQFGEEGVYFSLHVLITLYHKEKSRKELKSVTWRQELRETMEEPCLLLPGLFSLLFYIPQGYLSRDGTANNGLGPSTSFINQMLHRLAYRPNLMVSLLSWEFPLLRCLQLVSSWKKTNQAQ